MGENEVENKKKRRAYPDRVTLQPDCLDIVEGWKRQVSEQLKFGSVTRNDLVNWLIRRKGGDLAKREVIGLAAANRDPVKELEFILKEARRKKVEGEEIDISKLLKV